MRTLFPVLVALITAGGPALAGELQVDKSQKNLVKFTSSAQIETFSGTTDKIDGYVLWAGDELKPDAGSASNQLYFEVQLNGLDTGIGLRNRHMRDDFLETDKFPLARYSGRIVKVDSSANQPYIVTTAGKLAIHGVEQPVTISGRVTPQGEDFRVHSAFAVKLPDYAIKVPTLMFLKINETIQLELDFSVKLAGK